MPDASTAPISCRGCGIEIFRKFSVGRAPTACTDCRLEASRASSRRAARNRYYGVKPDTTYICGDCDQEFPREGFGPKPQRCPACRRKVKTQRCKASWDARQQELRLQRFLLHGRPSTCLGCGVALAGSRRGPRPKHCRRCFLNIRSAREYTKKPSRRVTCADCGRVALASPRATGIQRCKPCAKNRAIRLVLAWRAAHPEKVREISCGSSRRRRAIKRRTAVEKFSDRYILERDCWTCGICRRRINPARKWPHPLSASIDHVIPLARGGEHTKANCRASHLRCNVRRWCNGGGEQLALIG